MSRIARLLFPLAVLVTLTVPAVASADVHVRGSVYWGAWDGIYWVQGQDGSQYNQAPSVGYYDQYGRRVQYTQYAAPPPPQNCGCNCCNCGCSNAPPPPEPPPPQAYGAQPGWYAPAPAAPAYAAEPVVAYTPEEEPLKTVGVGIGAWSSTLESGHGTIEGAGGSLLLRLRGDYLAAELDLGGAEYPEIGRTDGRFGTTLYLNFTKDSALVPYALVGLGLNTVHYQGMSEDDAYVQGYAEAGGGAGLKLGDSVFLSGDLRLSARGLVEEETHYEYSSSSTRALPRPYPEQYGPDDETGFEVRLAAHVFF